MTENKEVESLPRAVELAYWKPRGRLVMVEIIDRDTGKVINRRRIPKKIFFDSRRNCVQEEVLEGGEEK